MAKTTATDSPIATAPQIVKVVKAALERGFGISDNGRHLLARNGREMTLPFDQYTEDDADAIFEILQDIPVVTKL